MVAAAAGGGGAGPPRHQSRHATMHVHPRCNLAMRYQYGLHVLEYMYYTKLSKTLQP